MKKNLIAGASALILIGVLLTMTLRGYSADAAKQKEEVNSHKAAAGIGPLSLPFVSGPPLALKRSGFGTALALPAFAQKALSKMESDSPKMAEPSRALDAEASPASAPEATPKVTPKATTKSAAKATTKAPKPAPKPASAPSAAASGIAAEVIQTAKSYLGVPYVWGGTTPAGFDCSGFIQYVFAKHGITLPRVSADQYNIGSGVSKSSLKPGDLVFFTTYKPGPSHVGIYLGNNQFIHESSGAGKVLISSLTSTYYTTHYIGARRVIR